MKVECTWGIGPDILVVLDETELLFLEKHSEYHLDLTAAQALDLSIKLEKAAMKVYELMLDLDRQEDAEAMMIKGGND